MSKIDFPTLYPDLDHALRIAEFCGFPVCVIVSPDYAGAHEDYQLLKAHYRNVIFTSEFEGSMVVEFFRPNSEVRRLNFKQDVYTHGKELPTVFTQVAEVYIKIGIERLSIGVSTEIHIRKISQGIAQFYGYEQVEVEHVVEALHRTYYYCGLNSIWVCAENAVMRIGSGIRIDVLKPSVEEIEKAISILSELLKEKQQ